MTKFFLTFFIIFSSVALASAASTPYNPDKKKIDHLRKEMHSEAEMKKTAEEFEAVSITKMLQHMYSDVKMDPLFDNSSTEGIYKDLLLTEYGKAVAKKGDIGLAKSILRDMKKMEGKNVEPSAESR